MDDVLDEVKLIISKHCSLGVEALKSETRLEEIDIESLDLVEIIFEIEERFQIEVPQSATKEAGLEFMTVGQIVEGVRSVLAKSAPS
jgi:acyl carrier protein